MGGDGEAPAAGQQQTSELHITWVSRRFLWVSGAYSKLLVLLCHSVCLGLVLDFIFQHIFIHRL